jgi:uncharacterized protein (DUF305 family)
MLKSATVCAAMSMLVAAPVIGQQGYTKADVAFVQGMMQHHAQALLMASMVPARTRNPKLRSLAQRIDISQRDEIKRMQSWLETRHESVPMVDIHPVGSVMPEMQMEGTTMTMMPGMLTQSQLEQLSKARSRTFDKLFLKFMIQHHNGALVMVKNLFATTGSGQEPELFAFASDVDSGQRAEIARMQAFLDSISGPSR